MKLTIIPVLLLAFSAFAQEGTIIPRVPMPEEFASGIYAEGTNTRLTQQEVAEFLPWAQNAKRQLENAQRQSNMLPLRDRMHHMKRAVESVVGRSGGRQYQMFMRYSLNRGLLLARELENLVDMNAIGSQESVLDIINRSVKIALSFYESDLSFQERATAGNTATTVDHAGFAAAFMREMHPGVVNVLSADAQYRLLYKLIEMVNYDLSQDSHAARYAETIVEAFELTESMSPQPSNDDRTNLRMIRRLNQLQILQLRPVTNAQGRVLSSVDRPACLTRLGRQTTIDDSMHVQICGWVRTDQDLNCLDNLSGHTTRFSDNAIASICQRDSSPTLVSCIINLNGNTHQEADAILASCRNP